MNPDQNPYPVDYLNQIAPQAPKPKTNNIFVFGLIGGVILLAIMGVVLISSAAGGPTQKMHTLAARLLTLQDISTKSQKTLKSGALRSLNSTLAIQLANTNRDIATPLAKNGVDVKKIDKNITLKEDGSVLRQKLENARLNAVYDRVYVNEMNYQLNMLTALIKDIYTSSGDKTLKDFLMATDGNLQPIKKQLSEFTAE